MRIGIIDLGTNSVRFDVFEEDEPSELRRSIKKGSQKKPSKVRRIYREKLMVRLGEGLFESGRIQSAAANRTLLAFQHFSQTAELLGLDRLVALGTSALRDGKGSQALIRKIKKITGIQIRVISGPEEARLIAVGILGNEKLPPSVPFAFIDIGGGSMEVSLCKNQKIHFSQSFPLGTARLSQTHLVESPPTEEEVENLRRDIRNALTRIPLEGFEPKLAIGTSGTIRALGKILGNPSSTKKAFRRKQLETLNLKWKKLTQAELRDYPKMESNRADMILGGSILLEETLRSLKIEQLRVSEFSLRNGVLIEELNELKASRRAAPPKSTQTEQALIELASHFGISESQARRTLLWANALFKGLSRIHGLSADDEKTLCQAALLRNIGSSVSLLQSGPHAEYILTHLDFQPLIRKGVLHFGSAKKEVIILAKLCAWHPRQYKVSSRDLSPLKLTPSEADRFLKILSLLRLVDAFDLPSELSLLDPQFKVELTHHTVTFRFARARHQRGMEYLRLQQRSELFEKIFGLSVLTP